MVIAVCFGILLAMLILRILHYLPHILLILFALWLIGSAHSEPYSCQMYREAARKCAANTIGKCYVEAEMERLYKQCLREGGNP